MSRSEQTPRETLLRYELAPDAGARAALDDTLEEYSRMMAVLEALSHEDAGANLVRLHELAYETVRAKTNLPSRLVTLGLRDFAANRDAGFGSRFPLDEKLFALKGPSDLTISTVQGRVSVPFAVVGYSKGWNSVFPAYLIREHGQYEIHIGVRQSASRTEENMMMNEGILSRMGRLIAGVANAAIDKAEGANKVAIIEQAIREIDNAANEARSELGKTRAEEFRIKSRRKQILADLAALDEKIRTAISIGRDDLAKAGVSRQIDLESQIAAIDKALADVEVNVEEGQKALQAVLATRREAQSRLDDFKRSEPDLVKETARGQRARPKADVEQASAIVSRLTGVPIAVSEIGLELDELDRLHRERAIEARLARFKSDH
jgi:hypothetical protein